MAVVSALTRPFASSVGSPPLASGATAGSASKVRTAPAAGLPVAATMVRQIGGQMAPETATFSTYDAAFHQDTLTWANTDAGPAEVVLVLSALDAADVCYWDWDVQSGGTVGAPFGPDGGVQ